MNQDLMTLAQSMPAHERGKLWLPSRDFLLTLDLPDGFFRMHREYRCPFTGQYVENIAQYKREQE